MSTSLFDEVRSAIAPPSSAEYREVRFEYSADFPVVLSQLKVSLLVSTYQAGKLAVIGTGEGKVTFEFHHLDQAMGIAVGSRRIASADLFPAPDS